MFRLFKMVLHRRLRFLNFRFPLVLLVLAGWLTTGLTYRVLMVNPGNPGAPRELMVYLWYPAQNSSQRASGVYFLEQNRSTPPPMLGGR